MTATASKLSIAALTIAGSLIIGFAGASAQAIYVAPYAPPVVVAPGGAYVAPPAIVREPMVVERPAYVPAPVYSFGAPLPPYGYSGYGYAEDVLVGPEW